MGFPYYTYAPTTYAPKRRHLRGKATPPIPKGLLRQIYRNRGELKVKQFNDASVSVAANAVETVELTNLTQGDDSDERIGRKIRGVGFKIRGRINDRSLDMYIVISTGGITPAFSYWNDVQGGLMTDNTHYEFREIADLKNYSTTSNHFATSRRWKKGITTYYTGSAGTSGIKNKVFLVFVNTTGAAITAEYSINYYYRDH